MWKPAPREVRTTIGCARCKMPLTARRTCFAVYLRCERCDTNFPLQDYVKVMDPALEQFIESLNCDRV